MSFYSQIVDRLNTASRTKDAAKVALAARDAVRSAVKFLFEKKGVAWDDKTTLLALIHSRTASWGQALIKLHFRCVFAAVSEEITDYTD